MKRLFYCLNCENRLFERKPSTTHRCGNCGSSAVVSQDDLRQGGRALSEVIEFPLNVAALFSVSSKARTMEMRKRAVKLMLIEVGFTENSAMDLARKMWRS